MKKRPLKKLNYLEIFLWYKPIISLIFCVFIITIANAQNNLLKLPDSLKNKTYEEYGKGFYKFEFSNPKLAEIYSRAYLTKAKNEKDIIRIANGFTQISSIYGKSNINLAIQYCDSIILLTKNLNNFEYPGFGYLIKGMCYNNIGNYKQALENYLTALDYAVKNKNSEQLFFIKNRIGQLKLIWGNYKEALIIFKSQLEAIQQKSNFKNQEQIHLSVLFNLSNSFILLKKYDSALFYTKIGIQKSLNGNIKTSYHEFIAQSGEILFYQNKYKMALDSIKKAFPFESSSNGLLNNHYYRGKIYQKQNYPEKAFYHFSKADSIYTISKDVVPEVRDIQEYFINYYKSKNDIENQLKYIDRLLHVDSIIHNNHITLNETIFKKYDTPLLLSEKQEIILNLKKREKRDSLIIYVLGFVVVIILAFIVRFFKTQRTYKNRFKKLLFQQKKEIENSIVKRSNSNELNGISPSIIDAILKDLKFFEINNSFLNNAVTLNNLAIEFNTNSTYLSKVINAYKEKNFSAYISDLRIEYCIEKLKIDEKFRRLAIKGIAYEMGFNNTESFSKAFYRNTGIHPSYFIKEIERQVV